MRAAGSCRVPCAGSRLAPPRRRGGGTRLPSAVPRSFAGSWLVAAPSRRKAGRHQRPVPAPPTAPARGSAAGTATARPAAPVGCAAPAPGTAPRPRSRRCSRLPRRWRTARRRAPGGRLPPSTHRPPGTPPAAAAAAAAEPPKAGSRMPCPPHRRSVRWSPVVRAMGSKGAVQWGSGAPCSGARCDRVRRRAAIGAGRQGPRVRAVESAAVRSGGPCNGSRALCNGSRCSRIRGSVQWIAVQRRPCEGLRCDSALGGGGAAAPCAARPRRRHLLKGPAPPARPAPAPPQRGGLGVGRAQAPAGRRSEHPHSAVRLWLQGFFK